MGILPIESETGTCVDDATLNYFAQYGDGEGGAAGDDGRDRGEAGSDGDHGGDGGDWGHEAGAAGVTTVFVPRFTTLFAV